MKLIVANHNQNKIKEIYEILKESNIELVSLLDLNDHEDIIEDGITYEENAFIKAKAIYDKYKSIVFADDSGIEITALNDEPGVNSKRFSDGGDLGNNLKVLELLKNNENREARFVCTICLYDGIKPLYFKGEVRGTISTELRGTNGFGYNPIFIPEGYSETLGELSVEIKDSISHRKNALTKLSEYLKTNNL